jgi:phage-related protein
MALKLSFTIEAIDKATARVKAINKTIASLSRPARDIKKLWAETGIGERSAALGNQLRSLRTGALYLAGFGTAAVYSLKHLAGLGDQAVNTAKRVGITVEAVQRLNFAAEQNGSNAGEMADGLKFLNRNAVEAATGSQQAATWFRRAGVSVKDANGKIKPTNQLIAELADRFNKMPDGAKKTALSMGLLGRSGENLIPTLNLGSKGLDEMARKAEWLGAVMDKQTAQGLDDLGDNMDDVGRAGRGIFITALKPLLPMLNAIVQGITKWLVANRALIAGKITAFIEGLAEVLPQVWKGLEIVGKVIGWLLDKVNRIVQFFGGWQVVIVGVAAVIAGKLVFALGALSFAFVKLGIAILTTPLGWFAAAIAVIAGLAYLVIKNWEPISSFFTDLWGGIVETFNTSVATITDIVKFLINTVLYPFVQTLKLVNSLMPEAAKRTAFGQATQGAVNWLDSPAQSPFGKRAGAAMQQVGGVIKLEVTTPDGARVKTREVRSESGVDFEVDTGVGTPGGAW